MFTKRKYKLYCRLSLIQISIFSFIGIWFCLSGCGEEETPAPIIVKTTTPPTLIATNVQGGPIPVNTPIILIFSKRVHLTSAQRGISVRSAIDAEVVKGVITLEQQNRAVKFTPTEQMTAGPYVLTVLGVEDLEDNTLTTPFSIFFNTVEVDITQQPADVIPPRVVNTIPVEGGSVKATGSLVVRFDEEVDPVSAQAGIVVSGIEGLVEVGGAVAVFKPQKRMAVGKHTLAILGVRDLAGNVMGTSVLLSFEVIAPPADEITPPVSRPPLITGGRVIFWEAENFTAKNGNGIGVFKPPHQDTGANNAQYKIVEASNGAFVGSENGAGGVSNSWLKYVFNASVAGDWYFWGRVIGPPNSDNSFFWGVDIKDADAKSVDNGTINIWDFNEAAGGSVNFPFGNPAPAKILHQWAWYRLSSRSGPFPGRGSYDDPTPLELTAGKHTFHLIDREDGAYLDAVFATTDKAFDANETPPDGRLSVEPHGRLATMWANLRRVK